MPQKQRSLWRRAPPGTLIGTYDEIVPKIKERYSGVLTTLAFNFGPGGVTDQDRLAQMVAELKAL